MLLLHFELLDDKFLLSFQFVNDHFVRGFKDRSSVDVSHRFEEKLVEKNKAFFITFF